MSLFLRMVMPHVCHWSLHYQLHEDIVDRLQILILTVINI